MGMGIGLRGRARTQRVAAVAAVVASVCVAAACAVQVQSAGAVSNNLDNKTMDEVVAYSASYFGAADDSLMGVHRELGATCIDCHELSDGTDPSGANAAGKRASCLKSGCHDDWESIEEATGDWAGKVTVYNPTGIYNPHANNRGDADCGDCHKMHSAQTLTCAQCHDITVPEGWEGYY